MIKVLLCSFGYLLLLNKQAKYLVTSQQYLFCSQTHNLGIPQCGLLFSSSPCVSWGGSCRGQSTCFQDGSLTWPTVGAVSQELSLGCRLRTPAPLLLAHSTDNVGFLTRVTVPKDRMYKLPFYMVWVQNVAQCHFC